VGLSVTRGVDEPRAGFGKRAEATNRLVECLVRTRALRGQLLGAERQVQLDLIFDLTLPLVAPTQREMKPTPDAAANHGMLLAVSIVVTVSAYSTQFFVSARRCARPAVVIL